jgi:hypothetical protein
VETITDAVSIHSIKKAEYARRLTQGQLGHVTILDHFKTVSIRFLLSNSRLIVHPIVRPMVILLQPNSPELSGISPSHLLESSVHIFSLQRFIFPPAGYSLVTYFLQIKDRHNGNILLDREGHLVHIDFGFMLSNSPGNIGFEAAPFKLPLEYIEVLGGVSSEPFREFKRLFKGGFEAARKHCDRIISESYPESLVSNDI